MKSQSGKLVVMLAVLVASLGCERAGTGTETPAVTTAAETDAARPARTPGIGGEGLNVLLVSVDTTRADHIGCYGHPEVKTPNIDRLAAEGTRFTHCISSAPLTLPSHTTMLTGSYPYVHGARDNGLFVVDEANHSLPELFKAAGYATHAEVAAAVLDEKYGLAQGFDTYGGVPSVKPKLNLKAARSPAEALRESTDPEFELETPKVEADRKADVITDRGIELLTQRAEAGERFFMFLHYFDPHWPHEAPEPFASQYDDGYYAEIAYFDDQFGRLIDAVRDLGLAEKTLVILTSDHGEGRGEHGEFTHSAFLYDSTLHVPLIIWSPGSIPAGQVVETQVRLVDLAPTIVDFARLELTEQMQGSSLLPLIADPRRDERRACYADTMVPKHNFGYSQLRALRADGWKFILAPRPELYHVGEDTSELFNVVKIEPERAERMKEELRDIISDSPAPPGGRGTMRSLDEEEMRKLAALGYVRANVMEDPGLDVASELDFFEPEGINPKDRAEVIEAWASGLGAFRVGEYEMSESLFRRFIELEPEIGTGPSYLGRSLMMLERYDEAIVQLRRAVELEPNFIDSRALGNLLAMRGEYREAAERYREVLKAKADDPVANLNLGMILASQQQYDEALECYDTALASNPEEGPIHLQRGICLRLAGKGEAALVSFDEARRLTPERAAAHVHAAAMRHLIGETDAAIAVLEQAVEIIPDDPLIHHKLAEFHAAQGDREQAGERFARVAELMPDNAMARQNLGSSLINRGRYDEAIVELRAALQRQPEFPMAMFNLAIAFDAAGRPEESCRVYEQLIALAPRNPTAYSRAADVLVRSGKAAAAVSLLRRGYALLPDDVGLANELAWLLATAADPSVRNGPEAVQLAEFANAQMGGESSNELDTLAAAYAEAGRFDDAVVTAERALAVARESNRPDLAGSISARLELFRQGQPYRQNKG